MQTDNQADTHIDERLTQAMGALEQAKQAAPQQQFLSCLIGERVYGINILTVREIRAWIPVTPIPKAPSQVLGVMNLRGTIVPVIDLRRLLSGVPSQRFEATTVVIIVAVQSAQKTKLMGVVVDGVSDVHAFAASEIHAVPEHHDKAHKQFMMGLATVDEQVCQLLDLHEGLIEPLDRLTISDS